METRAVSLAFEQYKGKIFAKLRYIQRNYNIKVVSCELVYGWEYMHQQPKEESSCRNEIVGVDDLVY